MNNFQDRFPFRVSLGVLVLANLIGNSIVCAVILRIKFMRTPVNYLLLNLAIADIMVGVFILPGPNALGPYLYTHPGGTLGDWFCKTISGEYGSIASMGLFVSTLTLSAVAYERFQAVVHPFTVKEKVTKGKVFQFIAVSWTVAFGAQIFAFFGYHFKNSTKVCEMTPRLRNEFIMYIKIIFSILFGFSFISMIVFYGRVICELRRKQNQIFNREQLAANRVQKRITFMLITVTVIFAATWGAGSAIGISFWHWYLMRHIWVLSFAINSSVNCFLYTLFSSQFRKGLKNIFRACYRNYHGEIANETNIHDADNTGENSRSVHQSNLNVIETKL